MRLSRTEQLAVSGAPFDRNQPEDHRTRIDRLLVAMSAQDVADAGAVPVRIRTMKTVEAP
jgi:hypothetical protein